MDTLRIILIIIGIAFIVGIYLFQTNTKPLEKLSSWAGFPKIQKLFRQIFNADKPEPEVETPPPINRSFEKLSPEQLVSMSNMVASKIKSDSGTHHGVQVNSNIKSQSATVRHPGSSAAINGNELLVTLTILPKPGNVFSGKDLVLACKLAGLQLGEYNIFHRYALINEKVLMTPVCSLVNLFEPGYFNLESIDDFTTKGLSLFMQLPGPVDGRDAFLILMDVAEKLSLHLDATICDETRSVITTQTKSHLKEKIENYRFKLKMDSLKK